MARSTAFENLKKLLLVLTPSQKRDFRKGIRFWGEKTHYEGLYDIINHELSKNPDFSFDDYLKLPAKRRKAAQKDFNSVAAYLYDKILESARKTSPTGRLRRALYEAFENIYFLFGAELYASCAEQLDHAKKIASELDSPVFNIEINFWEVKLLRTISDGSIVEKFERIVASEADSMLAISQNAELKNLTTRLYIEYSDKNASPATLAELEVFEKRFLANEFEAHFLAISAQLILNFVLNYKVFQPKNTNQFAGYELGEAGVIKNQQEIISLILAYPRFRDEDPSRYWAILANYFSVCFRLNRLDLIDSIEPMLPQEPETIAFLRYWAYFNLLKLIKQNRFADAVAFVKANDLQKRLVFQRDRIPHHRFCNIQYLASLVLFVQNELAAADGFLVVLRQHRRENSPKNVVVLSAMLHLVILFEQKLFFESPVFLESEMRKTRRFLVDLNEQDAFNKRFLLDFERMAAQADRKKLPALARESLVKLPPLLDLKPEGQPFKILLAWLHAKGFDKPIVSVIQDFI